MDLKRIQADEYELQYYDFTTTVFIAQFKEVILETIRESIDDLVLKIPQCHANFDGLFEEYKRVTLEELKGVEDDIRSYFAIPKHVLLPEDANIVPCSQLEINQLQDEIKVLEEEYKQKRAFKFLCEKQLDTLNNLQKLHDQLVKLSKLQGNDITEGSLMQEVLEIHTNLLNKLELLKSKHKFKPK